MTPAECSHQKCPMLFVSKKKDFLVSPLYFEAVDKICVSDRFLSIDTIMPSD